MTMYLISISLKNAIPLVTITFSLYQITRSINSNCTIKQCIIPALKGNEEVINIFTPCYKTV